MILSTIWIIIHMLSFSLFTKGLEYKSLILFLILGILLYVNIGFITDTYHYLYHLSGSGIYRSTDPAFNFLQLSLKKVFSSPELILTIIQLCVLLPLMLLVKYVNNKYLLSLIVIMLSPGFFLGFENGLRQGIASSLLLLSFSAYMYKQKYFLSLFAIGLASLMHFSSLFFTFFYVGMIIFLKVFNKFSPLLLLILFTLGTISVYSLFISFVSYLGIYDGYITYNNEGLDQRVGRIKFVAVFLQAFVTEAYLRFNSYQGLKLYRDLRFLFAYFMLLLAGLGMGIELISRLLLNYLFFELLLLLIFLKNEDRVSKLFIIFNLFFYGLALNVLTILRNNGL